MALADVLNSDANRRLRDQQVSGAPGFRAPGVTGAQLRAPAKAEEPGFKQLLGRLTQSEDFLNFASNDVLSRIPGWGQGRDSGSRILGRGDYVGLEDIPLIGPAAALAWDSVANPLTLLTAGFGAPVAAGFKTLGPVGRGAAALVEPIARSGRFATRVGAEAGVNVAGRVGAGAAGWAAEQIAPENETAQAIAEVVGAIGAGAYGARTLGKFQNFYSQTPAARSGLPEGDPVRKLLEGLTTAKRANMADAAVLRSERGQAAGAGFAARQGISDPRAAFEASRTAMARQYTQPSDYEPLEGIMTPEDIGELFGRIGSYKPFQTAQHEFERNRADGAFIKLLAGERLEANETKLLSKVFGVNLAGPQTGFRAVLGDVANIPRAVMASMDFSAPFGQAGAVATRREWWGAWGPMMKAAFKPEYARAANEDILSRPNALLYDKYGVRLNQMMEGGTPTEWRDDAFRSALAEHLPLIGGFIRRSDFAYTTFLNRVRADMFDRFASVPRSEEELQGFAKWINDATGAGNLTREGMVGHIANAPGLLFAPNYLASRVALLNPTTYARAPQAVRKQMARDMAGFFGMGMTALGLMALTGKATGERVNVEMDPRSSDFGRVRIGNNHFDPWGGLQPLMRYFAQVSSGQVKTSTGDIRDIDRATQAGRFVQGKLAPVPGFLLDWLRDETYLGEEFDISTDPALALQLKERAMPLFMQEMADAIRLDGAKGALRAVPSAIGLRSSTYGSYSQAREDKALQDFGTSWDRLTETQRNDIERRYAPELAAVNRDAKEGEYRFLALQIDDRIRQAEADAVRGLARGNTPRQFNERMADISADRLASIRATRAALGFKDDPEDVLSQYLALRNDPEVTVGGVTDYALLDQKQEAFKAAQTDPQVRARLDDFSSFDHDPSAQWWFDAKANIREAGYWEAEQRAFDKFGAMVARVAPGITTHDGLERAAREATSRAERVRLEAALSRINSETKRTREAMRRRDADLDRNLHIVYGTKPMNPRVAAEARRGGGRIQPV